MCCPAFFGKRFVTLGFFSSFVDASTTFIYSFGFVRGMKIEVDTRVESREDLLRVARLLEEVAGSMSSASASEPSADSSAPVDAMPAAFGLFDSDDDDDADDREPVERVDARSGFGVIPYE